MLRVLNGLVIEHFCFAFNYHQSDLVTLDFRRTLPLKSKRLYFQSDGSAKFPISSDFKIKHRFRHI